MLRPIALALCLAALPVCAQTTPAPLAAPPADASVPPSADASVAVATDARPLPDTPALLKDVERNQKIAEAVRNDYTYRLHRVQEEFAKDGSVKKTTVTDEDSISIHGVRVNRVTARDGKPLTPEEARKESERIDKEAAKGQDRREKAADKGKDTNSRGDEMISAARILELGTFTNPRRISLEGRDTIVVDYEGDPNAKTHNAGEGMIKQLAGTVWIDEADRTMVRAEGRFANDFKIAGGLVADVHKGTNFRFRATKVNGEVWLPAQIDGRGTARILLFVGLNGALHLTASDYRKFRSTTKIVEGTGTTAPPEDVP